MATATLPSGRGAPTLAWDVNDRLSLGAAVNIDYQQVSFSQRNRDDVTGALFNFDLGRSANAFGFGPSLGLLCGVSDSVTVGAAYKSKQHFSDLEYRFEHWDLGFHYMYPPENIVTASSGFPGKKMSLEEQSIGVNLGYRWD